MGTNLSGKLLFVFILSSLLSCVAAWVIAGRYKAAMRRLLRIQGPVPPLAPRAASPTVDTAPLPPAGQVSLADNRRAGVRLALMLLGLSILIASTAATLWWRLAFPGEPLSPTRIAAVALLGAWPVVPALGVLWRWSRWRVLGALALWSLCAFPILLWRSIEPRPLQLLQGMVSEMGLAIVIIGLITLGNSTRAIAPWLFLPFSALAWSSIAGLDLLARLAEQQSPVLQWLPDWIGVLPVFGAFALLPWLIAWWPLRWLGRQLGRAYSRQWLSELLVVFTAVWAIALFDKAIPYADSEGLGAAWMFAPLLWIPPVVLGAARFRARPVRPPTLLVLRVFQQDAQLQSLFDHVIERWRLSGNTLMIAGTDLATRTLDGEDLFMFLDRRLPERFASAPDVAARLASIDAMPDADGRFRVNECYCHDSTWQDALNALVERADVVLMDLRGFKAHNAGCRFELEVLARTARPLRITVLIDERTDRAAAEACIADGRLDRFTWIDGHRLDAHTRRDVLASLF
jgi:hypothetical protein